MSASVRPSPLAFVIALFFLGNTGSVVCAAYATAVPQLFVILYWIGTAWGFSWWVLADCRERGVPTSIDHGWFIFYLWPVAVPYHVLKTRGSRGLRTLLAIVGGFLASCLFSIGVYYLLVV